MLAAPDKIIVCPGVHDGLTARVALSVGFDALYMVTPKPTTRNPPLELSQTNSPLFAQSGAGTAASRLGQPDLGLTTAVARTAEKYILQGFAAFHLEDQVMAKRCGHLMARSSSTRRRSWRASARPPKPGGAWARIS